jgi:hypothetical protein
MVLHKGQTRKCSNLLKYLLCILMSIQGFSHSYALSVQESVNSLQTSTSGLPSVDNPKGHIGYILANIFYNASDGSKNGLIRPEYIDGIGTWTLTGSNAYFTYSGNVGIGTSTPTEKLDIVGDMKVS